MSKLTHFNSRGEAHMVDVGDKPETRRVAVAEGRIEMNPETLALIIEGGHKKGDVLAIARIAGIMAAKKTADLVPLCHPLALTHIAVELTPDQTTHSVMCRVRTETTAQTGVEIEAMTAVQISLLTIYDMCKAIDRGMVINSVQLLEKSGGKSGIWEK